MDILEDPVDCWLHVYEGCLSGVKTCGKKWSVVASMEEASRRLATLTMMTRLLDCLKDDQWRKEENVALNRHLMMPLK
jgi:hypothetical protein